MAIDTYITCTVDPAAASKPDLVDHVSVIRRGTANALDVTIAFDKTKVAKKTILRGAVLQMLKALDGGNELT